MIIDIELIIQSAKEAKNMAKKVAVGGEDFVALRRSDSYYVDKTEFLYELIEKNNNAVTLLTRPRRFGKTLLMSMIESFLSIFKKDSADVFEGLNIMQRTEFVNKHMNQYPVLFISLKDIEGLNFESAFGRMKSKVSELCDKHEKLIIANQINRRTKGDDAGECRARRRTKAYWRMSRTTTQLCAYRGIELVWIFVWFAIMNRMRERQMLNE